MAEKETVFSSKLKYSGIFNFGDFYLFCYDWLTEEAGLTVIEGAYKEKLDGASKNIEIEWSGDAKLTDYFKFSVKVGFRILGLTKVELVQDGKKIKTNKGTVEMKIKGVLVRDYAGKFEVSGFQKFLRSIYEKWVIPSRVEQFQSKVADDCNDFLAQAKAYLDLEGKK